jgi:hypothetical protein
MIGVGADARLPTLAELFELYLQPDGVSLYRQPDGVGIYLQP